MINQMLDCKTEAVMRCRYQISDDQSALSYDVSLRFSVPPPLPPVIALEKGVSVFKLSRLALKNVNALDVKTRMEGGGSE
ncbi:hypothetical protein P5673_030540 [Acropora cervicornis]|uniref:Uncharacterized protein n=1 Tax=Acropora cervicornis TaxID=6130 RepID=A0AAD9PUG1_ACRCE|nr:hypothetical protein P5673_030540 [Acropora cervicornis]